MFFPLFAGAVFFAVPQAGAVWFVFDLYAKVAADPERQGDGLCRPAGPFYFPLLICLVVFVATCSSDLKATYHYLHYVRNVPSRVGTEEETKALIEAMTSAPAKLTNQVGKNMWVDKTHVQRFETFASGRFSAWRGPGRTSGAVVKLTMEAILLAARTWYVLYAPSNEDLLMKAVALTFASLIDDTEYSFCEPHTTKGLLKSLPHMGFSALLERIDKEYLSFSYKSLLYIHSVAMNEVIK